MMSEKDKPPLRFGLFYDFRNPAAWQRPYADLRCKIWASPQTICAWGAAISG
jgi:hypothetical protein